MLHARRWMAGSALAGLGAGFLLGRIGLVGAPTAPELDAPRQELAAARKERVALAAIVERLRHQLDGEFEKRATATSERSEAEPASRERERPAGETSRRGESELRGSSTAGASTPASGFDAMLLAAMGVRPTEIERLRERLEWAELEELELQIKASAEGWMNSARYFDARDQLWTRVRGDVGDGDYDRMLYAAGRNNRVAVSDVLGRSAAAEAGLHAGDIIVRYDERPIFNARELQAATAQGVAGSLTPVDVVREGDEVQLWVSRGPLGVRLRPLRYSPSAQP